MTGSSWRFERFENIIIAVNSNEIRSIGNLIIYLDVIFMEFIPKQAKVHGSDDDDDDMSVAGCDEVNDSDIDFIDDIIQDQDTLNYIG